MLSPLLNLLAISRMDGIFQCFVNTTVLFLIIEHNISGLLIIKLTNKTQGIEIFAAHTPNVAHFLAFTKYRYGQGCWSAMKTITFENFTLQGDKYTHSLYFCT